MRSRSRPQSSTGVRAASAHSTTRTRPATAGARPNSLALAVRKPSKDELQIRELVEELSDLPPDLSKNIVPPPKTSYLAYEERDVGKERFERMEKVASEVGQRQANFVVSKIFLLGTSVEVFFA